LVFSFFSLNPAPFCILDEIDAPLDDFNTSRFINMVEEMSEKVQITRENLLFYLSLGLFFFQKIFFLALVKLSQQLLPQRLKL